MPQSQLAVERLPVRFETQDHWVISRPFFHGGEPRVHAVFRRVAALSDNEVQTLLDEVLRNFSTRHHELERDLEEHFRMAAKLLESGESLSPPRRQLIGSYYCASV